jgi:arylsulfatase A-like enzyme
MEIMRLLLTQLFLSAIFVSTIVAQNLPKKPNIIYIMADDLGWSDVGYNGAKFYETPNIDALRASGMEFTSAYPGAANCMPSRSCIISGMYVTRTQMWTPGTKSKGKKEYMKFLVPRIADDKGDGVFPSKINLDPSVTSIAEVMNTAGYRTAHFGKWHMGPDTQGFDVSDPNGVGGPVKNYYGQVGVTETLSEGTVKFIEESKDAPFFVYLCYWDVHSPIRGHDHVKEKYDKKLANGNWDREWNTTYAAMIEAVDNGVGQIRQAVKDAGIVEDTLIVFTSDNGGASFATWCDPLKGAKGAFYEGGIRVANCMSWPGVIEAGSVCDTPITGVDYMPSFAELGGARLPKNQPVDGGSFVPLLTGDKALTNRSIFWHYPLYLQGSDYNQVVNVYGTEKPYWRATPCSVIRKGDWKLIQFFEDDSIQLFNLKDDLGEQTDLAKSNPKKAQALLKELKAWQQETKAVIPSELNPDFNPNES